ncbi:MAG: hypothetical protein U5K74_15135 [Gemmatimonadaceae bacterium]|nr:hypothetical protein [Gemmatimonadaceae bacterium]
MNRSHALWMTIALTALPVQRGEAQGAADPRFVRAFGTLYTTAQLGGLVKAWCDARAPETRAATDTALLAWKAAHQLDDVEARADSVLGARRAAIDASVSARRETVWRALDKDSRSPDTDCRQMLAYLNRSANPQRINRAEYVLVSSERARAAASGSSPATTAASTQAPAAVETLPATGTAPSGAGRGTVFTVAQLSVLTTRDPRTAGARLKRMGTLTVQGTLEASGDKPDDTVWLKTLRDGWRSTDQVKCYDMSFRRLYDAGRRDITIRGTVREREYWIVLENCQLVTNTAGLAPSTLSDSGGLKRAAVAVDRIRTAPNGGLTMAQIEGMYQSTELRYNPMTMLFDPDESTYLLLTDGWLYDNLRLSPHDLDVATSRRLEPQHWHRWRRAGTGVEMQEYDEYGRPDGEWKQLKATARPTIGSRRLNGTFRDVSSASAGIPGGGGAFSMSTTSYSFRPDGTFSWTNFTQMYGSSNVGTGPGGGSIVVGGASVGPGGTSVSSVGGGDDGGTYTTDGYTLELRTRSGKVIRFSIFSWDSGKYRDFLVINGTTYSPPK